MKPVFLIGFMGAGKTAVGQLLACKMHLQFVDLDKFIEQQQGAAITDIFAKKNGEIFFRKLEQNALKELSVRENIVIACGGGTPCTADNLETIKRRGTSFYIEWSVSDLLTRLQTGDTQKRPLLAGKIGLQLVDTVQFMLNSRLPFYRQANFTISGNNDAETAENIAATLKNS